ncbi:alpha/beta fold hydrolase [Novosphingobium aureum]|nr:alpha/beta hydrolase [Novosphingobium aureum]
MSEPDSEGETMGRPGLEGGICQPETEFSGASAAREPAIDRRAIPAAARESLWHGVDGAPIRRIDIPACAPSGAVRGSLLFMPGRGDCYEKWLETLVHWARRGWQVTSADWRGQALSGRLGMDATTGHVEDFELWLADYAHLWKALKAESPGPHVAVAHSMGGNLALRAVAEKRVDPDALVLSAPMLGIHPAHVPARVLRPVARVIRALGDPARPAWKVNERPEIVRRARAFLLTHDRDRYADEQAWYEARPGLVMGPASWGWIVAALGSIRALEKRGVLEAVTTPVLLIGTSADGLVSWPAIRRAARRLPHGELLGFGKEAAHEILREADPVRDKALARIEDFLNRAAPARG